MNRTLSGRTLHRRWLPPLLAGGVVAFSGAQDKAADPLESLRMTYRQDIARTVQPLREKYCRALEALEQKLAEKNDPATAAKIRTARRKIEAEMGVTAEEPRAAGSAIQAEGRYEFPLGKAALSGGVTWHPENESLKDWVGALTRARWLLPAGLKAGGYEVELAFSCATEAVGRSVAKLLVKGDYHTLKRDVRATTEASSRQVITLGTLRLRANAGSLEISCDSLPADGFQLLSLRLLPVDSLP